jgi:hypothetical protein
MQRIEATGAVVSGYLPDHTWLVIGDPDALQRAAGGEGEHLLWLVRRAAPRRPPAAAHAAAAAAGRRADRGAAAPAAGGRQRRAGPRCCRGRRGAAGPSPPAAAPAPGGAPRRLNPSTPRPLDPATAACRASTSRSTGWRLSGSTSTSWPATRPTTRAWHAAAPCRRWAPARGWGGRGTTSAPCASGTAAQVGRGPRGRPWRGPGRESCRAAVGDHTGAAAKLPGKVGGSWARPACSRAYNSLCACACAPCCRPYRRRRRRRAAQAADRGALHAHRAGGPAAAQGAGQL